MVRAKKSLIVEVLVLIALLAGCGGGGGSGGSDAPAGPSVSPSQAAPGAFVTLSDASFADGQQVAVTFRNASGYAVTLNSMPADGGRAKVPVPPWYDDGSGGIGAGEYTLALADGRQASVEVEALPELTGVAPGTVTKLYLEVLTENFRTMLADLDEFETQTGYDATALRAATQAQLAAVEEDVTDLVATGTLSVPAPYSGSLPLSAEELATLDQLLYIVARGAVGEMDSARPARTAAAESVSEIGLQEWIRRTFSLPGQIEATPDILRENTARAAEGLAQLRAVLDRQPLGGLIGDKLQWAQALVNKLFVGVSQLAANGSRYLRTLEGSDVPAELIEVAPDVLEVVAPEVTADVRAEVAFWVGLLDKLRWITDKVCGDGIDVGDYQLQEYCLPTQVRNLTSYSQVAYLRLVGGPYLSSGDTAKIRFVIAETLPGSPLSAANNTITVDWGDETQAQSFVWGVSTGTSPFGMAELEHPYTLPAGEDHGIRTVTVTVVGDNEPQYTNLRSAEYQVWRTVPPLSIEATIAPSSLEVGQPGAWEFRVSGGWGPFLGRLDWGDGVVQTGEGGINGFRARHTYTQAGEFAVRLTVTDSDPDPASATVDLRVRVGDPALAALAAICPAEVTAFTPSLATETLAFSRFTHDAAAQRAVCGYGGGKVYLEVDYAPGGDNAAACGEQGALGDWIYGVISPHTMYGTRNQVTVSIGSTDYSLSSAQNLQSEISLLGTMIGAATAAGLGEVCPSEPPALASCPAIYDSALDADGDFAFMVNLQDKDGDGLNEDRTECMYWESGPLRVETPYRNDLLNGTNRVFFESGQLLRETPYLDSREEGTEWIYFASGGVKEQYEYTAGLFNGVTRFYWDNGQLWEENHYLNGVAHGEHVRYSVTGELVFCSIYADGEYVGSCAP